MKLSEIQSMIEKDSVIDGSDLGKESINIPFLHSKWYNFFNDEIRALKSIEAQKAILRRDKMHYYLGKGTEEEYAAHPLDHRVLKQDLDVYMESDMDIIAMNIRASDQKMKCETIEAFLKQISQRSFNIKNAIEWHKFRNGVS